MYGAMIESFVHLLLLLNLLLPYLQYRDGMVPSIIDVWGYDREFCSSSSSSSSSTVLTKI